MSQFIVKIFFSFFLYKFQCEKKTLNFNEAWNGNLKKSEEKFVYGDNGTARKELLCVVIFFCFSFSHPFPKDSRRNWKTEIARSWDMVNKNFSLLLVFSALHRWVSSKLLLFTSKKRAIKRHTPEKREQYTTTWLEQKISSLD